jgi:predicted nucleic acid-binding protein
MIFKKRQNEMRVYLDNCCFNRPFDDQSLLSIRLETEAKLGIQEKIKSRHLSLGWSYILDFENNANPFLEKRVEIQRWKEVANSFVNETEEILVKMNELTAIGLKPLDALHIACAVSLQCQYFLTVDKGILKKATGCSEIIITNPVNFIIEWEAK